MEVTSTEAQNNFGQYLKLAWFEDVIVTRNGKPSVVISKYEEPGLEASAVAESTAAYNSDKMKISYEEFLKLSEASENRYEYIDGEVYLLASPSFSHQRIVMEISNSMYKWFKRKKCKPLTAPFDVTLLKNDDKNVVQPDILVICDTENIDEKGRYRGTPSLVVEVLSDSTRHKDMLRKLDLYLNSGVQEYWIVNPFNNEVYVYLYEDNDIKDFNVFKGNESAGSMLFKGFEISLEQVFLP